jgi:riboflavin synthase
MFTGLVETTAEVARLDRRGREARLVLRAALADLELGESVSTSGVCLTVAAVTGDGFEADVSAETLAVTTLGALGAGGRVNVERSLRAGDRLGGHLVMGHVDGVGTVTRVEPIEAGRIVVFEAPPALARFFAPKGSVAVDGVSLTVNRLAGASGFEVMLVPHTLAVTTLGAMAAGARVNLEIDVLARYVARQLDYASGEGPGLRDALERAGFIGPEETK